MRCKSCFQKLRTAECGPANLGCHVPKKFLLRATYITQGRGNKADEHCGMNSMCMQCSGTLIGGLQFSRGML